jgi:hypothetical protein
LKLSLADVDGDDADEELNEMDGKYTQENPIEQSKEEKMRVRREMT